jgi:hypothetical protein
MNKHQLIRTCGCARGSVPVQAFAAVLALVLLSNIAVAGVIKVELTKDPNAITAAGRELSVADAQFTGNVPFNSQGTPTGAAIKNKSDNPLKDLHLTAPQGMTFDPLSTGGSAFPEAPEFNADKTQVTFSGANFGKDQSFVIKIPKGTYTGSITPQKQKPPQEKESSSPPEAGSGNSLTAHYDGAGNISFDPATLNFIQYVDGTIVTSNNPSESLLGSQITITPMQVLGSSPDVPGATILSDAFFSIDQGSDVLFAATLGDVLLYPDTSVSGFDTVLQATLFWQDREAGSISRYLDELLGGLGGGNESLLLFRSSLLSQTADLITPGSSTGPVFVNLSIPEPSTALLLLAGIAGMVGRRCSVGLSAMRRHEI